MGVLFDYVQARIEEVRAEAQKLKKTLVDYIRTEQPLRKALLLEWLDYARPLIGTRWEHKITEMKRKR